MKDEVSAFLPFDPPCRSAFFLRRYKRFIVDAADAPDGPVELHAHTNNTGSMLGLLRRGAKALFSPAANPARKLPYTWEAVSVDGFMVGINTLTPNRMLRVAWQAAAVPEMSGYDVFRSEAKVGKSRLDALLTKNGGECPEDQLWVECKNVTLVEDCVALFPDAVTERGQKHLHELMDLAATGARVALFFLVQRPDGKCFGPADCIDPEYARLFWQAVDAGVEVWAYVADVSEDGIRLSRRLPLAPRTDGSFKLHT